MFKHTGSLGARGTGIPKPDTETPAINAAITETVNDMSEAAAKTANTDAHAHTNINGESTETMCSNEQVSPRYL